MDNQSLKHTITKITRTVLSISSYVIRMLE